MIQIRTDGQKETKIGRYADRDRETDRQVFIIQIENDFGCILLDPKKNVQKLARDIVTPAETKVYSRADIRNTDNRLMIILTKRRKQDI